MKTIQKAPQNQYRHIASCAYLHAAALRGHGLGGQTRMGPVETTQELHELTDDLVGLN